MAEPSSALQVLPAVVLGGTTVVTAFPGVDALSVIGAAGGAGMFILLAVGIPEFWRKVLCFFVSWIFGYLYGKDGWVPEALSGMAPGIKAFVSAFLIVVVCTGVMEFVNTGKLPRWVRELINLRRGNKGEADV